MRSSFKYKDKTYYILYFTDKNNLKEVILKNNYYLTPINKIDIKDLLDTKIGNIIEERYNDTIILHRIEE